MKIKGLFKYLVLAASLNSVPVFADNLLYPIESTPDAGTVLDEKKAAKVRKLLEHAITRNKQEGVIEYVRDYVPKKELSKGLQDVQVAMIIGDTKYTLLIQNYPQGQPDVLYIYQRPKGEYDGRKVEVVSDTGLDGRCELGYNQELYDQTIDILIAFYHIK